MHKLNKIVLIALYIQDYRRQRLNLDRQFFPGLPTILFGGKIRQGIKKVWPEEALQNVSRKSLTVHMIRSQLVPTHAG
jgi:hypothetical protein